MRRAPTFSSTVILTFLFEIGRQLKCSTECFVTCGFFLCVFAVADLILALCYKAHDFISQVDSAGDCNVVLKSTIKDIKV